MAFYDPNRDEDEGQDPSAGTGVQTGPQSGEISSGVTQQPAQVKANAPDKGSNFASLNDYLNANKSQAQKLGDQTAGVINQSANDARSGISVLNEEANQKIKGQESLSGDLTNKLNTSAETLSDDEKNKIKSTASATYKGPQDITQLSTYQDAATKAQKANQNLESVGTEEGRMGLISQVNSKPRTQGMNVFDNALLQAGGGREKLQSASQANQDVKGALGSASENVKNQIGRADDPSTPDIDESSGAIGQTNKAQADAYKQIQDALTGWKSSFNPRVQEAQQNLTDLQKRVTGDLGDNPYELDQETLELFGLNPNQNVYNLKLGDYFNQANPNDINAANVATEQDYARYAALADLAGESQLFLDPANIDKAGTAPTPSVNREGMTQELTRLSNQANQQLSKLNAAKKAKDDYYNKLSSGGNQAAFETNLELPGRLDGWNSLLSAVAREQELYNQLKPNQKISVKGK